MSDLFKCPCAKCGGRGEIKAFSGIAGGVCFSCNGKGFRMLKSKPVASQKFAMLIDGKRIMAKRARNIEAARRAFAAQIAGSKLAGSEFTVVEVAA